MPLPSFRERLQPWLRVEPPRAVFMAEAKRRRPFLPSLALLVAATLPLSAHSQQPGTLPTVRLEPHDGKTTFYLGEPIRLDLVFENHTGAPFMLNIAGYGDLSEKVEITPAEGWFQWQTQSGHDYAAVTQLADKSISIPVQLDEGFVFRQPGEYRIRITTARLERKENKGPAFLPPVTPNEVTIELRDMPAGVEAERLAAIRADLASAAHTRSGEQQRRSAMHRLATLQGDAALLEKIRLLKNGDDDFRGVYREAFATTHDLRKQLELLESAWKNPALTPQYDRPSALAETRLLLAGRNLRGWQMFRGAHIPDAVDQRLASENRADMVALLDSMPQRQGESRTMGAYFLIEFGGLTEAQRTRAIDYAIEEFPHMDDIAQHMLLQTARPPLRDPRLVPLLKQMLNKNPADQYATATLIAIAPTESKEWIVKTVCATNDVVLLDTFKDSKIDRLPEVDTCLATLLRVAPDDRSEFNWNQRALEAARFATPAILPALREGWKSPRQDSAGLAVLMRTDPAGAVTLLDQKVVAGTFQGDSFFATSNVYKQIAKAFPTEVLSWLRVRLEDGTDNEASTAAYALSIGGDNSDKARVQQRLERLRAQWQGKQLPAEAQQVEMNLASTLGTYESKLFLDEAQRHQLGQGCLTDQCRLYLH